MSEYKPCHRNPEDTGDQERYNYCKSLLSITDHATGGNQKGIFIQNYMNMKTFEETRTFAVAKLGDHRKKGIVFNFCPFCGEKLIVRD